MLVEVLDDIRVPRLGPGRPRTRPEAVVADKAYSSGKTRKMLAARGVRSVIPQKSDEIASRQRKGSRGGRPPQPRSEERRVGKEAEVSRGARVRQGKMKARE